MNLAPGSTGDNSHAILRARAVGARAVRRIQILTIADLLAGKAVDLPHTGTISTLKRAPRADTTDYAQPALIGGAEPEH